MTRRNSWRSANYRYVTDPNTVAPTIKAMKAKFAGKCEKCNGQILPGEDMLWNTATRKASHATCPATPVPVAAIPQIACPKCGQTVYQQTSKYGKPYFTNSANRQDFHPCRVWTGRRGRSVGASKTPTLASAPVTYSPNAPIPFPATPILDQFERLSGYPSSIVAAVIDNDDRTWSATERDLERIDKDMTKLGQEDENKPEVQEKYSDLVTEKTRAVNRLALLVWERIRYDS